VNVGGWASARAGLQSRWWFVLRRRSGAKVPRGLKPTLLILFALTLSAQPLTLDQVLGFSFPSSLTAAPTAGKIAWVSNARGVRNILVAEPPDYRPRRVTNYTQDDGQELESLRWLPDASAVVYVRGSTANPTSNPQGVSPSIWIAAIDESAPRKLADGTSPAVAPRRNRIAFLQGTQLAWMPLDGKPSMVRSRGASDEPAWSPDGDHLAFVSRRGDHDLIAVYRVSTDSLRYLDPSTDSDDYPSWSPDGASVAFVRIPSSGLRPVREARRSGQPWSIRVAPADAGTGREVFRAAEGRGSVFHELASANQLMWTEGSHLVFPSEADGWTHLYCDGALLTPGAFEVEHAAVLLNRREIVYSSNQGDIDRRHLWKASSGTKPVALTSGSGIEVSATPTSDGAIAFLRSDAQHPLHVAIRVGSEVRDVETPGDFPMQRMIAPQQVIFSAADGLQIHGQLFVPPGLTGRAPAIVFFHGGPRRQMLLGWHHMYYYSNAYALNQYLANSGYIVLSVNFRSGIGYGLDFREAPGFGASGGSDYNDVQGAGVYLRSRSDVDPARIGVWGGSYGGYLTAMALARASDLFKCGSDFHGVHDWATELHVPAAEPDYKVAFESSPLNFVKGWRSPVLLIQGDDDRDVQFNQTVRLAYALRSQKVDVEELVFPDEIHDFLLYRSWREAYAATTDFFKRKL
jgi:dipeptidyl aminopeptidase/acylaminoacyl peptidase